MRFSLVMAVVAAHFVAAQGPEPEPVVDAPPSPPAPPSAPSPPSLPAIAGKGCAPAFGTNPAVETLTLPAGTLVNARTLAFNPAGMGELWIGDESRSGLARLELGSSTLDGSTADVKRVTLTKDRAEYHYLDRISSISFDPVGQFATCQESANLYRGNMPANFFMGPTMYDTRPRGWVNSKQEPCAEGETCFLIHVDMLHESPLCMGIAHDNGAVWHAGAEEYRNVYWAFGGGHSQLVRFDFETDHGPGSMEHKFANVRRYSGLVLTREEGVPSHMAVDAERREMFVSDSGADRVVLVQLDSGAYARDAKVQTDGFAPYEVYSSPEQSFNYSVWDGLTYSTFAKLTTPSGIAISRTTLYVGSYTEGAIFSYDRASGQLLRRLAVATPRTLMGLTLEQQASGAEGTLYFVAADVLGRVTFGTGAYCASGAVLTNGCADGVQNGEETATDCGGRYCARCAVGSACAEANDCSSSTCTGGVCTTAVPFVHTASLLSSYLNSDFYYNSFLHHAIHRDAMGASYLNPYPIMEADFCQTVGISVNASVGSLPNCSVIDFDALLMGGCFCHHCLRALNPCVNGGTCVNYQLQGYTCSCPSGTHGDHCQHTAAADANLTSNFPWSAYARAYALTPRPPSPASPPPPSDDTALIGGLAALGGSLLLATAVITAYISTSKRSTGRVVAKGIGVMSTSSAAADKIVA